MSVPVSVVIPAYNAEKYIVACVDSVLGQTFADVEIVIVNNGSRDRTEALCTDMASRFSKIRLISQENQGVSVARNVGMQHATGDYLIFLDADDTMPSNAVEALLSVAQQQGADMTMGKIAPDEQIPLRTFEGEAFLRECLMDSPLSWHSVRTLYKRSFVEGLSFERGYICGEDNFFIFQCATNLPKVVTVDVCVYDYTVNLDSVSRSSFTHKRYESISGLMEKKEAILVVRIWLIYSIISRPRRK